MKFKALLTALTLCLLMAGQELHAFAEPTAQEPTQNDLYDQLIKEGWTLTAAGVLQRQIGAGKVETLGFGAEGLRFKLEEMRSQLAFLREEYKHRPLPETRRSIRAYRIQIARVTNALQASKVAEEIDVETAKSEIDCMTSYGANVDAFPLTSGQGVGANTHSYFNSDCGETGEVYAHAYGKATGTDNLIRTFSRSDPTSGPTLGRIGGNVTASANGTVAGVKDCYSYSYATVTSYDIEVTYAQSDTNYTCPPPPPAVVINGPTSPSIQGYSCSTFTWSVAVYGGAPAYTHTWYRDGSQVGTGSSYSATFCGNDTRKTEYVNLSLLTSDSAGQTASDTHTTKIEYLYNCTPSPQCLQMQM